jgi:hypothetical protein
MVPDSGLQRVLFLLSEKAGSEVESRNRLITPSDIVVLPSTVMRAQRRIACSSDSVM